MKLSMPKYGSGKRKLTQISFGGYNHNRSASEGEIYDMKNLTSDDYPILSVRRKRTVEARGDEERRSLGLFVYDRLKIEVVTDSVGYTTPELFAEYRENGKVSGFSSTLFDEKHRGARRHFAVVGDRVIIMPDKKYLKLSEASSPGATLYDMECSAAVSALTFGDGTYGGETAKANTITFPDGTDLSCFSVGDAVTISGCTVVPENNKTPIIEEIDGNKLIFLEYAFTIPEDAESYEETGSEIDLGDGTAAFGVLVKRCVPDLDYVCENENRLWGCRGDTIYASKLGDPLNWNVFEGSGGSWACNVISAGDFTACASLGSYVYFFKEESIYKVYGNRPSNFQASEISALGVKKGSEDSLAALDGVLFYHSRDGIMAFSGGIPQNISSPLGYFAYEDAVGGADGTKYYVSMRKEEEVDSYSLFVYDTRRGLWMREDDTHAVAMCRSGKLYIKTYDDFLFTVSSLKEAQAGELEGSFSSFAEFGDFYEGSPSKKVISKLYARIELEAGANVTFYISFDGGEWEKVSEISAPSGKRSFTLPIIPRRCDHYRIKIEGEGVWRLYSLSRESHAGSDL